MSINPDIEIVTGTGAPVILHVPHASREIPPDVREGILLSDDQLEAELDASVDSRTDQIVSVAAEFCRVKPMLVINRLSRLVVDPERLPDESEELASAGRGAVYTRTCAGDRLRDESDQVQIDRLLAGHYTAYALAMEAMTQTMLDQHGAVTIIDVHSYPPEPSGFELNKTGPRPEICIGTAPFHTPPELADLAEQSFRFADFTDIEFNSPYKGCYVPLRYFGTEPRVQSVMVEIRRDVYLREDGTGISKVGVQLATGLTEIVRAIVG
ncbi:MAG: N-formylglutamate amidohydrolase [Thermoleophilaceae bacterium]|nr:N-formylglutamate amidohydrolase [Thermoleophilaceae bacterium]